MARGFLSGIAMGVVVSAAGLTGLSVMTTPPEGSVSDVKMPETPVDSADQVPIPANPVPTSPVQSNPAPMDEAMPSADEGVVVPDEATPSRPTEPLPTEDTSATEMPPNPDDVPTPDAPVAEMPPAVVPNVFPAQSAVPSEGTPVPAPMADAAAGDVTTEVPAQPAGDIAPLEAGSVPDTSAPTDTTIQEGSVQNGADQDASPNTGIEGAGQLPTDPETAENAPTPSVKSAPLTPIGDLAPNVKTNRLPSISDEDAPADADAAEAPSDTPESLLAIERNAVAFERVPELPIMAILLKDEGGARAALGDLSALPFQVAFVVDATAIDAAEAVAFYRAQGAEVVVEVALPPASTPADAEVNFQVQAPIVDQGVAVLMNDVSGFQEDADLAKQVSQILKASGHGVVSFPQGLSTGNRLAIKAGVPAGVIFRDLDGAGQDGRTIRRFLDNAAFKARQTERVILFGRARPETLQALIEWSLGNRAKSVSVAPISTVLSEP